MPNQPTVAVVTGAASGIGRAVVERFADDDSYDLVVCLDVDEHIHNLCEGRSVLRPFTADVSDHDAICAIVDNIEETATIDAVVNNAGISRYFWIGDLEPDEWDRVLDVNLKGQYNLIRAASPRMYERGRGYIVNISSGAGQKGSASGGVHYSASKAGVFGLTKGLAKQLAPHVRVNCVVPGLVDTPLARNSELWSESELEEQAERTPLGRLGNPDDVARVIHFLCGDGAAYVTGSVINVDGGIALV